MPEHRNTDETMIILSMLDRIIMDDLLQESELEVFEEKKIWYDLWRGEIIEIYGLGGADSLLGWDKLKDRVVDWLKDNRTAGDRQAILDRCLTFLPYGPLRNSQGKGIEHGRVQASPEARELSLEKICRLLGLEDKWQELFPSQMV